MLSTGEHGPVEIVEPVAITRRVRYPCRKRSIVWILGQLFNATVGKDDTGLEPDRFIAVKHKLDVLHAWLEKSPEIGRASCRERGVRTWSGVSRKKKKRRITKVWTEG